MPAAVAIPSIIGAGTSIVGGILGSNAAGKAAGIQSGAAKQAAGNVAGAVAGGQKGVGDSAVAASNFVNAGKDTANDTLKGVYDSEMGMLNPYQQAGSAAVTKLSDMSPFAAPTAAEAEATPGYQFQLAQGMKALNQRAAATGLTGSSGALKSLSQYNQGLADTSYNDIFNRNLTTYNTNSDRLKTLAGFGQNANDQALRAGTTYGTTVSANDMNAGLFQGNTTNEAARFGANLGMEGANMEGNFLTGGASAQAKGVMDSANAWGGALQGVGNAASGVGSNLTLRGMYPNFTGPGTNFTPYNSANPYNPYGQYGMSNPPVPGVGSPSIPGLPGYVTNAPGATPANRYAQLYNRGSVAPSG